MYTRMETVSTLVIALSLPKVVKEAKRRGAWAVTLYRNDAKRSKRPAAVFVFSRNTKFAERLPYRSNNPMGLGV